MKKTRATSLVRRTGVARGLWRENLVDALLDAFPSRAELAQFVRYTFDVNLNAVTSESNLTTTTFELIEWADGSGLLEALVRGAQDYRPSSPTLHRVSVEVPLIAQARTSVDIKVRKHRTLTRGSYSTAPSAISISRMPVTGRRLVGRDHELEALDRAWDECANVFTIVAWAGVGKSSLVNHWLSRMGADDYPGADRVFAWSFYRQGTTSQAISADEFVEAALSWCGDANPSSGSSWTKGERLANMVRDTPTLLVLDGLEPLQRPPGVDEGRIVDPALQALVRELAAHNTGLCVITTRLPVTDVAAFGERDVRSCELTHLQPSEGAELLRTLGAKGEASELEAASREYSGHCLALTLLGSYLTDRYNGYVSQRRHLRRLEDDVRHGSHARRVMSSYEAWFGDGPEVELLRVIGLFDRPAPVSAINAVADKPAITHLTEHLARLAADEREAVVARLRRAGLLAEASQADSAYIDAHPLVREHFAETTRTEHPNAWIAGHGRLFAHFAASSVPLPESLETMQGLFLAVRHGCLAGKYRAAFREVYITRIMRGDEAYAARQLGSLGALLSTLAGFFRPGHWHLSLDHPDSADALSQQDQLMLLTHVGSYLTATRGYASPEVRECYDQLHTLATATGDVLLLYSSLISQWRYSLVSQPLTATHSIATEICVLGRAHDDDAIALGAYRALADTVFFLGRFRVANRYARRGVAVWTRRKFAPTVQEVTSPVITCMSVEAMTEWHLGRTDYAGARAAEAVDAAKRLGDQHAVAVALCFDSFVAVFSENITRARESAEALVTLSLAESFSFWLGAGRVVQGWASARQEPSSHGLESMLDGIRYWEAGGTSLARSFWFALAADVLTRAKRHDESVKALAQAEESAVANRERWWLPEIYRLRGVAAEAEQNRERASRWYERSFELAIALRSPALALRASISSAELRLREGDAGAAATMLESARRRVPPPGGGIDGATAERLLAQCRGEASGR